MSKDELEKRLKSMDERMEALHDDLRRYMESTNKKHYEVMLRATWDIMRERLMKNFIKDSDENLERMVDSECPNREMCINYFKELIERNLESVSEAENAECLMAMKKDLIEEIRERAPYKKCETCVCEISKIFDRQTRVMGSLNAPMASGPDATEVSIQCFEGIVSDYLEPIANERRMQIMLSLARGTLTFSELSRITGLAGGNLLFHLQKLQEASMIIQRHERGDYMITEKGYSTLSVVGELAKKTK